MRGPHARRIHIAFALAASFSLAGFQEETEIARWIDDLGHVEIARRSEAEKCLLKAGAAAMPALRKAIEMGRFKGDAESRARLENVYRLVGEIMHDAEQRPHSLNLVNIPGGEMTLGEALKAIERAKQCVFKPSVDLARKVRINDRNLPYRQVLDSIEDQLDVSISAGEGADSKAFFVKPGRSKRPPRVYLPGLTLDVHRTPFTRYGKPAGWRLRLQVDESGMAYLDKFQVHGMEGREWPLESCPRCGNKILLKSESKEAFRLTVQGDLVWTSNYMIDVADPAKGQEFKVGDATFAYEFFRLRRVHSSKVNPRLDARFGMGAQSKSQGSLGFDSGSSLGETGHEEHTDWCEEPSLAHRSRGYRLTQSDTIDRDPKRQLDPADIESVQVWFRKPICEPFKVTVTLPAE